MSTTIRGIQSQLKDGGIVLKLKSKNLSTTGFFWGETNFSSLFDVKCEEGELLLSVVGNVCGRIPRKKNRDKRKEMLYLFP